MKLGAWRDGEGWEAFGEGEAQSDMLYEKVFNIFFLCFNFSTLYIDRNIKDF